MQNLSAIERCCHHEWWRPVVDFEDAYEVSSCGRIYSHISAMILKPTWNDRYFIVCLTLPHRQIPRRIHKLVTEAFFGPRPEGMEVCHNDGDARNNHLANLRYGTPADNGRDKVNHQTRCRQGHELTPENIYSHTDRKGYTRRICRACRERTMEAFRSRHNTRAS